MSQEKRFIKRVLFKGYERVFTVSDLVLHDLERRGQYSRVCRWHHLVNIDRFRPNVEVRARLRADLGVREKFVLLIVAHLKVLSDAEHEGRIPELWDGRAAKRIAGILTDRCRG